MMSRRECGISILGDINVPSLFTGQLQFGDLSCGSLHSVNIPKYNLLIKRETEILDYKINVEMYKY